MFNLVNINTTPKFEVIRHYLCSHFLEKKNGINAIEIEYQGVYFISLEIEEILYEKWTEDLVERLFWRPLFIQLMNLEN